MIQLNQFASLFSLNFEKVKSFSKKVENETFKKFFRKTEYFRFNKFWLNKLLN